MPDIVENSKSNYPIPMYLFEGYLPLIVTLFAVHCNHRVQSCTVFKPEFFSIGNTFLKMLVTVQQQILLYVLISCFKEKWQTEIFGIPICTTAIFLSGKA